MSKRIFVRIIAAILMLCMILPVSGCNSLFLKVATNIADTPEEQTSSGYAWPDQGKRRVEVTNTYESGGTDAFYLDGEKCLKNEIEEFHLIRLRDTFTVYYYTAPANPSYEDAPEHNGGTGYYCLAAYDFVNKLYKVIVDGFYDKENQDVSFSFINATDSSYFFACLGNTFMDVYAGSVEGASIYDTFILSDDDRKAIRKKVGGDYVCTDIAYIDYGDNRIAASFMYVGDSEEEEISYAVYDINFDVSDEEPEHEMECLNTGILETDSIVSSEGGYPEYGTVFTYDYERDSQRIMMYRDSPFMDDKSNRIDDLYLSTKSRDEEVISFALREYANDNRMYLCFLFDDRLRVISASVDDTGEFSYDKVGEFALDKSDSFATFDVSPSLVLVSPEKLFACSLNLGFYRQLLDGSRSVIKDGSFYAAYGSSDGIYYKLIGFDNKTHKRTITNYSGDTVVTRSTETVAYTMNDLPYAKVFSLTIPYDQR